VASEELPGLLRDIRDGIAAAIVEAPLAGLSVAPFLAIGWRDLAEFVFVPRDFHVRLVVQ